MAEAFRRLESVDRRGAGQIDRQRFGCAGHNPLCPLLCI
jgi:hypothetical protein